MTLKKRANTIRKNAEKIAPMVAARVLSAVAIETPVDTGRARSNWVPGLGQPNRTVIDGPEFDKSGEGSIGANSAYIQRNLAAAESMKGDTVWVSNNLPYIQALNDGHSRQAPRGYVERAISAAVNQVKKIRVVE